MEIKTGFQKGLDKVKSTEVLQVADGLETFKGHEGLKPYFENSYGFVVFDKVAKVREINNSSSAFEWSVYSQSICHKTRLEWELEEPLEWEMFSPTTRTVLKLWLEHHN